MSENQTKFFEKEGTVGQISYPFRIGGSGLVHKAYDIVAKPMASIMTFGSLPLAFLLFGVHFVPSAWKNTYALWMAVLIIASVPVSWTFGKVALLRVATGTFEEHMTLLGRRFRPRAWPTNLFSGISYGNKGLNRGVISVVRLKCKVEGYLVDAFLYADHTEEAESLARKLSEASGLPVLGEEFTGSQHELNDLRKHAWLAAKYAKATP